MVASGQSRLQLNVVKYLPNCVVDLNAGPAFTKIKVDNYSKSMKAKPGFTFGGDITYYFKTIGKLKTGASLGLGYTHYCSEYSLDLTRQIQTTDVDNESVTRNEIANNMKETEKAGFLNVPILMHADYTITPKIDIYVKTGISYSFVMGAGYTSSSVYTATGYYPKYNVTLFDIDIDGSPYFYPTDKKMNDNNDLKMKNNLIIPFGLGVKYKYDEMIVLTAGINEMLGLRNISGYDSSASVPIISDDRNFNSIMQESGKARTNAFCIELGVSLNLWNKQSR